LIGRNYAYFGKTLYIWNVSLNMRVCWLLHLSGYVHVLKQIRTEVIECDIVIAAGGQNILSSEEDIVQLFLTWL
jgi:hypothetical protein